MFQNNKVFRCDTQTLHFKPRHKHCMVCLARHWRVRSLVPLAGKILKSRTRNQLVRSLVPLAGKILKWKTRAPVKFWNHDVRLPGQSKQTRTHDYSLHFFLFNSRIMTFGCQGNPSRHAHMITPYISFCLMFYKRHLGGIPKTRNVKNAYVFASPRMVKRALAKKTGRLPPACHALAKRLPLICQAITLSKISTSAPS